MAFEIIGKLKDREWETIDEAETNKEAGYLMAEYAMSYGADWELKCIDSNGNTVTDWD